MKILAITTALLFAINSYAQITTITTKEKEEPVEVQKYDSLKSLNIENVLFHKDKLYFLMELAMQKNVIITVLFLQEFPQKVGILLTPTNKLLERRRDIATIPN